MDKATVLELVEEKGIKFIEIWFSDILGMLKSFTIPKDELEKSFTGGMGFEGSPGNGNWRGI